MCQTSKNQNYKLDIEWMRCNAASVEVILQVLFSPQKNFGTLSYWVFIVTSLLVDKLLFLSCTFINAARIEDFKRI